MPPKRQIGGSALARPGQGRNGGVASETYRWITNAENRSVVTSVAFFAAGVAFLHSSWSEILLPPI